MNQTYRIFTDGSAIGSPGSGGWGAVLGDVWSFAVERTKRTIRSRRSIKSSGLLSGQFLKIPSYLLAVFQIWLAVARAHVCLLEQHLTLEQPHPSNHIEQENPI